VFYKAFLRTGALISVTGASDDKIQPEGLSPTFYQSLKAPAMVASEAARVPMKSFVLVLGQDDASSSGESESEPEPGAIAHVVRPCHVPTFSSSSASSSSADSSGSFSLSSLPAPAVERSEVTLRTLITLLIIPNPKIPNNNSNIPQAP